MRSLRDWQTNLENHFSLLKDLRPTNFPIFSFEHGLPIESVNEIKQIVREARHIESEYWLVWVVYATECGYEYDGGEYWETFHGGLKYDWGHDVRDSLRRWFRKFQRTYHGVEPQGRWARHFSIISWPITHAIVPKYLQLQLARKLYELRYSLKKVPDLSPNEIGLILAQNSSDTTERFQIFLQQQEIVGRLAVGILFDKKDASKGDSHILQGALQRIIDDLEKHSLAKSWLKEARSVVTQAPRIEIGLGSRSIPITTRTEPLDFEKKLGATPILVKMRDDSYSLGVQFEGFEELAKKNESFKLFLSNARAKIAGTKEGNPPGWLLRGVPKKIISQAPILNDPPISFSGLVDVRVSELIETDCKFLSNEITIFKINNDDSTSHIQRQELRAGWRNGYLLVTRRNLVLKPFLTPAKLNCEGFYFFHINTAYDFSRDDRDFLFQNGLDLSKNVSITPVGLMPIEWDGEGYAEWLSTDLITLRVEDNFKVDRYEAILDGKITKFESENKSIAYINIVNLEAGIHELKINAVEMKSWESISSAHITIKIIDRTESIMPASKKSFMATVLPDTKNLDDFWEQRLNIELFGPEGYELDLTLALKTSSEEVIHSGGIGKLTFPINKAEFTKQLNKFLNNDVNVLAYIEAAAAELYIDGKELGGYIFKFSRQVKPLRWGAISTRHDIKIKLINEIDSTDSEAPEIYCSYFSDYLKPPKVMDYANAISYKTVDGFGGLYCVRFRDYSDHVIVSTRKVTGGLQSLNPIKQQVIPDFNSISVDGVVQVIRMIAQWTDARCIGPLSNIRKLTVLRELRRFLVGQTATPGWVKREKEFIDRMDLAIFSRSYLGKREENALNNIINIRIGDADIESMENVFINTISRSGIHASHNLIKFAFHLEVTPESLFIRHLSQEELVNYIKDLKNNISIAQLARLLYLLWHKETGNG